MMQNVKVKILGLLVILCSFSCGKKEKTVDGDIPEKIDLELTQEESKEAGQLFGFRATNAMLGERFFSNVNDLFLGYYLNVKLSGEVDIGEIGNSFEMLTLLGARQANGQTNQMINVTPNPMNSLLWYLVFWQFSDDISQVCDGVAIQHSGFKSSKMRPDVSQLLKDICGMDAQHSAFDLSINRLIDLILLSDTVEMDRKMIFAFAKERLFREKRGREAVRDLVQAILYNPNLLIRK